MLPRLVLRVREAVRRLKGRDGNEQELSGAQTQARWDAMLHEIEGRRRAAERRLAEAERALNELSFD